MSAGAPCAGTSVTLLPAPVWGAQTGHRRGGQRAKALGSRHLQPRVVPRVSRKPQPPRSHQSCSRLGAVRTVRPWARDPGRGLFGVLRGTEDEPCSEVTASRRTRGQRCRQIAISWSSPGWRNVTAAHCHGVREVLLPELTPAGDRGDQRVRPDIHPSTVLPA